jgi:hypothetical protein
MLGKGSAKRKPEIGDRHTVTVGLGAVVTSHVVYTHYPSAPFVIHTPYWPPRAREFRLASHPEGDRQKHCFEKNTHFYSTVSFPMNPLSLSVERERDLGHGAACVRA